MRVWTGCLLTLPANTDACLLMELWRASWTHLPLYKIPRRCEGGRSGRVPLAQLASPCVAALIQICIEGYEVELPRGGM